MFRNISDVSLQRNSKDDHPSLKSIVYITKSVATTDILVRLELRNFF